jgi:probable rRNA maturation factor
MPWSNASSLPMKNCEKNGMNELVLRNRRSGKRVDMALLRRITRFLLEEILALDQYEIGVHLVSELEIARLNESYVGHTGSTDIITFDYLPAAYPGHLHGELFICIPVAAAQARQFRTTWQSELTRYVGHGLLHLMGFDDLTAAKRRVMKVQENRLLKAVTARFPIEKLSSAKKAARHG